MGFCHNLIQNAIPGFSAILLVFLWKAKKYPYRVIIHFTPARTVSEKYRFLKFKLIPTGGIK